MPCMSYDDDPGYNNRQWKTKTDMLARIACNALSALEDINPAHPVFFDTEVSEWWNAHKEADAKAQAAKAEGLRRAQVKADALAKLTAEERKVLGVK